MAAPHHTASKIEPIVAGIGVLHWRGQEIEFEWQPIITRNAPPSCGTNRWRGRPRFICPTCQRTCYHLYPWEGLDFCVSAGLACRRCVDVRYLSFEERHDPSARIMRRIAKLRRALGMPANAAVLDDPPPPPSNAPRSKWLHRRRVMALRRAELRVMGVSLEDFLDRGD